MTTPGVAPCGVATSTLRRASASRPNSLKSVVPYGVLGCLDARHGSKMALVYDPDDEVVTMGFEWNEILKVVPDGGVRVLVTLSRQRTGTSGLRMPLPKTIRTVLEAVHGTQLVWVGVPSSYTIRFGLVSNDRVAIVPEIPIGNEVVDAVADLDLEDHHDDDDDWPTEWTDEERREADAALARCSEQPFREFASTVSSRVRSFLADEFRRMGFDNHAAGVV